ncbi:Na(+)-translocating NADH-quinone reductase subunit C [bacterium]|nr:Na(+)-translocating NADH-quinone reductase subunit C [bacterium]
MQRDSVGGTILVAAVLCVVCSVVVSAATVALKPVQEINNTFNKNKNVLEAAGIVKADESKAKVEEEFKKVDKIFVNLVTGDVVSDEELKEAGVADPKTFNPFDARENAQLNRAVEGLNGFPMTCKYAAVYLIKNDDESLKSVVLPVFGKGLWSTMLGYLALKSNLETGQGITFYSQGETPGLGGEVENPKWKAQWDGKELRDAKGDVLVDVVKGQAANNSQIDGLSGATITTKGVNNLVRFWLGPQGYGPFLENLKAKEKKSDG